ncbi:phage major capsid protein [Paucibacter sp. R3-3]|uniref:Phage major capsid protein n=1 Tax=Roseateles agri TaxID=3098619 RepID=A0ABU5DQA8_9BURK|nr:phage major capsid protein [Paucibacter sp. R3-3]MDY0748511.1 phage major capsid protein [Paucibacter sp. R3-3]
MKRTLSLAAFAVICALAAVSAHAMPDPTPYMTAAFHALTQDPTGLILAAGMPTVLRKQKLSQALGKIERKDSSGGGDDDDAAPAIIEIKKLIEDQGKAWKAFKETNDAIVKAKADGKAVSDLEAKMAKLTEDLDKMAEVKKQFDDLMLKLARPGGMGGDGKAQEALEAECKTWNAMLRADFQSKGKPIPGEVSIEQYTQYKGAFFELIRHGDIERLTPDQRKAMSAGSDPDGGYLMPAPTVGRMVKKIYELSIMRQIATVVPLSGDSLEGIIDNGETDAGWVSEMGSRNDTNTPQVGKYKIEAGEMYAQPKVTQKLIDDAATDIEAWLADKTANKFARVEGQAFWTGDGIEKPRGLATYPTAATGDDTRAWGTFEHIKTGADGDFGAGKFDPIQDIQGALKDAYLQNARWVMRREVRTKARKLKESSTDRYLWEPSLQIGQPERLNGYPVAVDQFMPALAAGSLSLAFGDFAEAYTIVDRMGVRTLRDPFTAKPYVRFYSTKRTGGGAVNYEAVKFLKFMA